MKKPLQRISRVILQANRHLQLRIHVKLVKDRNGRAENFHNVANLDKGRYGTLDLQSFLTLDFTDKTSESHWQSKSIMITQRNIFQIVNGFEEMYKAICSNDIFAVNKRGESIIKDAEKAKESVKRIYNLGNNHRIVLSPAIIFDDETNQTFEGVVLYINKTDNAVELPIDAFEALYYALKQVDIFVYSQSLLNYYLAAVNVGLEELGIEVTNDAPAKKKSTKHILVDEEKVTSTVPKKTDVFSGLEKEK